MSERDRRTWVSEAQAADMVGVHRATLARWRQDGIGPPCRVIRHGRRPTVRYHVPTINRWQMQNQHTETV